MLVTRYDWAQLLLKSGKFYVGLAQIRAVLVRMRGEYGVTSNYGARWNPLDTTEPMSGATPWNTFARDLHVWNYPSLDVGIDATLKTLAGVRYADLCELLREPQASDAEILAAWNVSGWGEIAWQELLEELSANYVENTLLVSGSSASPAPAPAPKPPDESEDPMVIISKNPNGTGDFVVFLAAGTYRGVDNPGDAAALVAAGAVSKNLEPAVFKYLQRLP